MFIGIFFSLWISQVWAEPQNNEKLVQNQQEHQQDIQISEQDSYQIDQIKDLKNPFPEQPLTHISNTMTFLSTIEFSLWMT